MDATVTTLEQLRTLYKPARPRSVQKQLSALDQHCVDFVALSRFVVISTGGSDGQMDASPRGGDAGFVKVADANTVLIPDWPGNNRLDTLSNIVETGRAGLIFLVNGVQETLRINGPAQLRLDPESLRVCETGGKLPKLVIAVHVDEAYLHCAKSIMRSKLWTDEARVERSALPSMGQMLKDQIGDGSLVETQGAMEARYAEELY
jgi:uncharacterized protein